METADASIKKFQKELNAGTVSLVLLAILDRSAEPLYGYQIAKSIEGAWGEGVPVKQGTLYPVLRSMEEQRAARQPGGAERRRARRGSTTRSPTGDARCSATGGRRGRARATSSMRRWRGTVARHDRGIPRGTQKRRSRAPIPRSCRTRSTTPRSTCAARWPTAGRSRPEAVAAAIDAYGTPEEVAAPTATTELTVAAALRKPPAGHAPQGRRTRSAVLRRHRRSGGVGRALLHAARARDRHPVLHGRRDRPLAVARDWRS